MNWWKRVGLSLVSAIAADALGIAVLAAFNPAGARWDGFVLMGAFSLYFVIPGWLISLPAVLWIKPERRWNVVTLAVVGTLIGPCIMVALDLWTLWQNPTFIPRRPGLFEYLATAISIVATGIYLGLVKAVTRDNIPTDVIAAS